jgi:hypothetical protein
VNFTVPFLLTVTSQTISGTHSRKKRLSYRNSEETVELHGSAARSVACPLGPTMSFPRLLTLLLIVVSCATASGTSAYGAAQAASVAAFAASRAAYNASQTAQNAAYAASKNASDATQTAYSAKLDTARTAQNTAFAASKTASDAARNLSVAAAAAARTKANATYTASLAAQSGNASSPSPSGRRLTETAPEPPSQKVGGETVPPVRAPAAQKANKK